MILCLNRDLTLTPTPLPIRSQARRRGASRVILSELGFLGLAGIFKWEIIGEAKVELPLENPSIMQIMVRTKNPKNPLSPKNPSSATLLAEASSLTKQLPISSSGRIYSSKGMR